MLALTSATYVKPKPPKCSPVREFGACQLFVTKGYWNKWAPNKYSACCRYVKKESLDCLCAAANSKFKFQVDISKALGLAAKCGKYYPKGTVLKCKTLTRSDDQCEDLLDQHFGDDLQIPDEISPPPPYYYNSPPPPKKSPPPPYYYNSPPPPVKSPPPPYYYNSPPPPVKSPPPPYYYNSPPPPVKSPPPPYYYNSPPPPVKSPPPPYYYNSPPPPVKSPPPPYY
ncbi:hypothetical protein AXG93_2515s1230 [Marchantia polymorpha subsp. ruderalis]|uniref:Bifunctional inhibitor/plant lipid transfer protein/seed storage helical domain-containing protein n=1 Tax=Marchantia polymorpha subsp. ruderalis TaxID=1480154 RepID=A0A176W724_MARPO|nr:hypothetical protein AXG93_2515s1230 [Marchantia polymorpha subsp. ruderalis]